MECNKLQVGWKDFVMSLDEHWNWYAHMTFKGYPTEEGANKVFMKWSHLLNRECYGVRYWKRKGTDGVIWARGTEYQSRGSLHYHALIGRIPEGVDRFEYMEKWYELAGISRIYKYIPKKGAEDYITKSAYAFKRGEIDLGGPLLYRQANFLLS